MKPGDNINGSTYRSTFGYTHVVAMDTSDQPSLKEKLLGSDRPYYNEGEIIYYLRNGALADKDVFNEYFRKFNVDGDHMIATLENNMFVSPGQRNPV